MHIGLRSRHLALLAAVCVPALAACGGDDATTLTETGTRTEPGRAEKDPDPTTTGALSAKQYRSRGNEICRRVEKQIAALEVPRSPEDLAGFLEKSLDLALAQNEQFEALEPPPALRVDHERSIALSDPVVRRLRALIADLRVAEDPAQTATDGFEELAPLIKRSELLSKRLGLKDCLGTSGGGVPMEQTS